MLKTYRQAWANFFNPDHPAQRPTFKGRFHTRMAVDAIADAEHASRVTLLAGATAAFLVIVATRGRLGYRPDEEPVREPVQEIHHRR
ncbi:hypothetical protein ABGB14_22150 [Nonomuraea sp. B10E15]|uniref:hypothetical protein n=1 Tax=Nonomuraea sp. B10E15 TaxID=3153560 RepID=UPI00325F0446